MKPLGQRDTKAESVPGACVAVTSKAGSRAEITEGVANMPSPKPSKGANALDDLPTAKDFLKAIALKEAAKASDSMREKLAEEAEKKALLEKLAKPSGVSDEERMVRAAAIIKRAAANGQTEVGRFPHELCTDRGRAINQQEPGWEITLTGLPKELFEFGRKI
jgi:hypothetical protein